MFEEEEEVGNLAATNPTSARKSERTERFLLEEIPWPLPRLGLAYAIKWNNERVSHRVNRVPRPDKRCTTFHADRESWENPWTWRWMTRAHYLPQLSKQKRRRARVCVVPEWFLTPVNGTVSRTHVRPESNTMFSECIRGTRRLRSLSDLRARPARTSPLTCMFADRIPGKVRNAAEARAGASLAARFGRQTGPRSGRRSFSREYLRTCMYQRSFISLALFLSFCHSPAPVLCTYLPAILSTSRTHLLWFILRPGCL